MLIAAILIALIILIDQLTKIWSVNSLQPVVDIPLWDGVLHLHYLQNDGAAFGMFSGGRWVFIVLSILVLLGVGTYMVLNRNKLPLKFVIPTAVILGGAIGNLIDRVLLGYVRDFIYVKIINFAIFNFADMCITVGAAVLCLFIILDGSKKPAEGTEKEIPQKEEAENDGSEENH